MAKVLTLLHLSTILFCNTSFRDHSFRISHCILTQGLSALGRTIPPSELAKLPGKPGPLCGSTQDVKSA